MIIAEWFYKLRGKPIPYYVKYPLWFIIWKPIRKYLNVVIIPTIPFSRFRVSMYRMIGYNIGKNVFIGMQCYMDDIEPSNTTIEDNVTVSYGTFFAVHGKNQKHTTIVLKRNTYIGMGCHILSGKDGVTIGPNATVGAGSLVNRSIPKNCVAVGCPARVIKTLEN